MNILFFLTPKEEVAHVEEDDTLRQVVEKLEYHGYSAIPLLALDGKYIGTITEGDLLWEMKEKDFPDVHRMEKIRITDVKRRRDNEAVKISESMEDLFEKITNQTLFRYYQELLSTAHLELFYCGSAERERVEEAISRAFAPLQRGRVVPPVIAEKKNAPETPREITERMDVTQGRLSMGWRASTNDAPAMMLANLIFGGYSNSKLFLNVREKLSLCYYASSTYHRSKGIVTVSSGIECRDVETAKREILAQLASVQRGEFEEWEVEGARACLIASLESRGDSAGRMEENALGQAATGIRETADELIAALRAVTNERIAEAAQSMTLDTVYFLTGEDSKDE